jgi:hypothetical protein
MLTRPWEELIRKWNWKAAFFSSLIRSLIFFFANLTAGWRAATGAMLAEWVYRGITSGFYGAMSQKFGQVEPEWQGAVAAMILLPLSAHTMEFGVHYLRHTPNLKASVISSMIFSAISTLFNVYAMRRGTMVVGNGSPSFADDMKALPGVIGNFLAVGPRWVLRSLRSEQA